MTGESVRDGVSDATLKFLEKRAAAKRLQALNKKRSKGKLTESEKLERTDIKKRYNLSRELGVEQNGRALDVSGFYLELVSSDIKHAYDGHSTAKESGDIDLPKEVFTDIYNVIQNYDEVIDVQRHKDGSVKVRIGCTIDGGKLVVVEIVSKSRAALQIKTMYGVSEQKYEGMFGQKNRRSANSEEGTNGPTGDRNPLSSRDASSSGNSILDSSESSNPQLSRMIAPEERTEVTKRMAELNERYGTIERGEPPYRDVEVPRRTSDDKKVSKTVRTVMEAQATPEEAHRGRFYVLIRFGARCCRT